MRHSIKHNNQPNSELRIYTEYTKLLALYAAAIRDDAITAERNPALYEIASLELGSFARNPSKVVFSVSLWLCRLQTWNI